MDGFDFVISGYGDDQAVVADPTREGAQLPEEPPTPAPDAIADWEVNLKRGDNTDTVTVAARSKSEAGAAAARRGWRVVSCTPVGQASLGLDGGA